MTFKAAFYKGTRPGLQGIYSRAVRVIGDGPYSHCELIFSDGLSASASFIDKGVRFKDIIYKPDNWDFIDLPDDLEESARLWFEAHQGEGYDIRGNVRFVLPFVGHSADKQFCSEAVAAALGWPHAETYEPNRLHRQLSDMFLGARTHG